MSEIGPFLGRVVGKLDDAGIAYTLTGSMASNAFGEPRASFDVDIIISATLDQIRRLCRSLEGNRYYVSIEAAEEALRDRRMFNIIDPETGMKADLIIRKERPFDLEVFRRRQRRSVEGVEVFLISPEDSILSKLEWAKQGGSDRQIRDAVGVAAVQGEALDAAYLRRWAAELGVADLLEKVLAEAERTR